MEIKYSETSEENCVVPVHGAVMEQSVVVPHEARGGNSELELTRVPCMGTMSF